jgi:hypothetical protein
MRNTFLSIMAAFMLLGIGCAGPKYSLVPSQDDNLVVYTQGATGQKIIVEIAPEYSFEGKSHRDHKGVRIEGYVYSGQPGKIFVTRLRTADFEKITGLAIEPANEPVRQFPPKTFYNEIYCNLVRAKAAVIGDEIVIAALRKSLLDGGVTCETIDSLDTLSARYPREIEAFNDTGDQSIQMRLE